MAGDTTQSVTTTSLVSAFIGDASRWGANSKLSMAPAVPGDLVSPAFKEDVDASSWVDIVASTVGAKSCLQTGTNPGSDDFESSFSCLRKVFLL